MRRMLAAVFVLSTVFLTASASAESVVAVPDRAVPSADFYAAYPNLAQATQAVPGGPVQIGVRELQQSPNGGVALINAPAPAAVIDTGTIAGQALTWVMTTFGGTIGLALTGLLFRLFQRAGINLTDDERARFKQIVLNAMHAGADLTAQEIQGKGQIEIKNMAVAKAVTYAQTHGKDTITGLVGSPTGQLAIEAIKAQIAATAADPDIPTPKAFDPVGVAAPSIPPKDPPRLLVDQQGGAKS